MAEKIEYEDKLEIDAFVEELKSYRKNFFRKEFYKADMAEVLDQTIDNFQTYQFSKVLICYNKLHKYVVGILNDNSYYEYDVIELRDLIIKLKKLTDDFIKKGLDNYQEEDIELSEKDKLKLQKQKAEKGLKELQEKNMPYLNMALGITLVIMSIVFMCIPSFFDNPVLLYHICGGMLVLGMFLLIGEIGVRQTLGWNGYTEKINSKKAFTILFEAVALMIPLTALFYFFSQILIIKILFFIQIWFCSTLMINGIALLLVTNISKNKEKKFNIWSFVFGVITILGFVIQLLQLFKVL